MGLATKQDNAIGYAESRLSTIPDKFRNKTFFLIHGTMDDNVHYQQSMALARSLETHDVLFRQLVISMNTSTCPFVVLIFIKFLIYRAIRMRITVCGQYAPTCTTRWDDILLSALISHTIFEYRDAVSRYEPYLIRWIINSIC